MALVLVIAGGVGVFVRGPLAAHFAGHSGPSLTAKIVTLGDQDKLYCPMDAVWSPDGKQIAVFTQTSSSLGDCDSLRFGSLDDSIFSTPGPYHAIGVIDAASGQLIKTLPFTLPSLTKLCGGPCPTNQGKPIIQTEYSGLNALSWSPDGKTIGFFFTYQTPLSRGGVNGVEFYGSLQLIPTNGAGVVRTFVKKAYLQPGPDKPYPIKLWHGPPVYTWNLTTGAGSYAAMPGEVSNVTTAFAPAYRWTASRQITPQSGAVAASFSPWSGGELAAFNETSQVLLYTANLWRWSPDGQYVAPNMTTQAFMRALGIIEQAPNLGSGYYTPPLVASPDAAMSAYLSEVSKPNMTAQVAWSPNGKLFAGLACQNGSDSARLTVRRTSDGDGNLSATFIYPPSPNSHGCDGDMQTVAWSADNATLASCDATENEIIFWRYHP